MDVVARMKLSAMRERRPRITLPSIRATNFNLCQQSFEDFLVRHLAIPSAMDKAEAIGIAPMGPTDAMGFGGGA
jgi:hypothetical protein